MKIGEEGEEIRGITWFSDLFQSITLLVRSMGLLCSCLLFPVFKVRVSWFATRCIRHLDPFLIEEVPGERVTVLEGWIVKGRGYERRIS